jgi:ATP-binding cassette subfamily B protein
VDAAPANSLERIISRRSLLRGHAIVQTFCSIAAVLLLVLLLLDLNLLAGLLANRGHVDLSLSPDEASQFAELTGLKFSTSTDDEPAGDGTGDASIQVHVYFDEHGILPAVWRSRNDWWGGSVAFLFRRFSWLQTNLMAAICLLSMGVCLFVARTICLRQLRLNTHRLAIEGVTSVRRQLHRQVLRIGPEDLDETGYESAIQLFVADAAIIQRGLFEFVSTIVRYPLELLGLLTVMLSLDWRLTLQWIAPLSLGLLILNSIRKTTSQKELLTEDRSHDEKHLLLAILKNARLTRGLGIEQSEHERFQKHLERYHARLADVSLSKDAVENPGVLVVSIGSAVLAFLVFLTCSNVLDRSSADATMTIAEALTFIAAMSLAIPGVRAMISLNDVRKSLTMASDKIQRFLNQIPTVSQAVGAKFLQPMARTLHFENVKYQTAGGRQVLDGVDFKLEVDKCYAIVSLDPIESKAVALMLPRFLEPREGRVKIDGEDIAWVTLESLRAETVFVSADDPPMEGTVFENIRGGSSDLTLQQVTEAAKVTHAHNFIVKLFNGYESVLTSQGETLDLGQRFRLGLARAIARNPALLIIEEPSGPLDEDTKSLLADAYDRICRERTVIFLPGRMSTVRRTDQVVVLHEGKVVAFGHHSQLVTQSPAYRHWEYVNFNEYRRDA